MIYIISYKTQFSGIREKIDGYINHLDTTDPCGTPDIILTESDILLLILTL